MGLAPGKNLKFYTSVAKGLKLKARKLYGVIPSFVEVTGEKLEGTPHPLPPPPPQILNTVNINVIRMSVFDIFLLKYLEWIYKFPMGFLNDLF